MGKKKTYTGRIRFKADSDQTGEVSAEFATLNVIDHDKDVTRPGAFRDGQACIIEAWNHGYESLPVGKGTIREDGDKAVFDGRFFLETASGLDHYRAVKALDELAEWSYTFEIEKATPGQFEGQAVQFLEGLDVWGVAPVQRGAGIATRTRAIKGQGGGAQDDAQDPKADFDAGDQEAGERDTQGKGEGQGGDATPSGPRPGVMLVKLEIEKLQTL